MSRLINILMLMLAAQLLLSVALLWPREQAGESDARTALLALADGSVDAMVISDGESTLRVAREEGRWIFPDYHGLPVERARMDRALIDLPMLTRGWPVAESLTAVERFEVADDNFQRRVEFLSGDESLGAIYVGTSPGFRKVHVRPAGDDAVYAVEFNTFELPVTADEWLDKTLLGLAEFDRIDGLDYQLSKDGDAWVGTDGKVPNSETLDALLNGLRSLRVNSVADIATAELLGDLDAPPTLTVTSGAKRLEYRLYEIEDAYYLQRDDIPVYFSLGALDYDRLNDASADSLFASDEASAEPADDALTGADSPDAG